MIAETCKQSKIVHLVVLICKRALFVCHSYRWPSYLGSYYPLRYKIKELRYVCLLGTEIAQSVRCLCYGLDNREIGVLFPAGS
jgi:hypothetical protein